MRMLLLAIGVLAATPAIAADQFDLVCTADKTKVRYRVDLGTQMYCEARCSRIAKIFDTTPSMIVFERHERAFAGGKDILDQVNRTTGTWTKFFDSGSGANTHISLTGQCRRALFSGFYPMVF
jgi:hypothetical protein